MEEILDDNVKFLEEIPINLSVEPVVETIVEPVVETIVETIEPVVEPVERQIKYLENDEWIATQLKFYEDLEVQIVTFNKYNRLKYT